MKNSYVLKIGIICVIVLIILASGCIDSSKGETKTYSDGAMSFNYPGSFNPHVDYENGSSFKTVAYFRSDAIHMQSIRVIKNKTEITLSEARAKSISQVKNYSADEVLSVTNETNPNGIVVERYTYVDKEFPSFIFNLMYFKIGNDVYGIAVEGPELFKQQITDITNIIFKSIK